MGTQSPPPTQEWRLQWALDDACSAINAARALALALDDPRLVEIRKVHADLIVLADC